MQTREAFTVNGRIHTHAHAVITYLMFWIRFRKELVMLRLRSELLTFARNFQSYRRFQVQL